MEPLNRALNRHQFIPRCPLRTCTFTHTTIHERERERLPRTTAHAHLSRYTCPRFGLLSLSLRSNRSTCQSYALYRFSRPSLSPCILSLGIEYVAIFTYMVNINWFRADPSLSQRSVIERATWFDIFLFLERIFKKRERESWCNLGLGLITSEVKFV